MDAGDPVRREAPELTPVELKVERDRLLAPINWRMHIIRIHNAYGPVPKLSTLGFHGAQAPNSGQIRAGRHYDSSGPRRTEGAPTDGRESQCWIVTAKRRASSAGISTEIAPFRRWATRWVK